MVLAVDHEHRRAHYRRIAGLRVRLRLPAVRQHRTRAPRSARRTRTRTCPSRRSVCQFSAPRSSGVARRQLRRVHVAQVRDHEHGVRVLVEAVRHLLEPEPDVLEADLLRHRQQRHGREVAMDAAHQPREDGRVAHAGVEDPQRRRRRPELTQLLAPLARDDRLLVAGVDERQVLLPVVVEPERRRICLRLLPSHCSLTSSRRPSSACRGGHARGTCWPTRSCRGGRCP